MNANRSFNVRAGKHVGLLWFGLMASLATPLALGQEKKDTHLLVPVFRVQPGQTKELELQLEREELRPGTRDGMWIEIRSNKGEKLKSVSLDGPRQFYKLSDGLEMSWDKKGVTMRVGMDAIPVSRDVVIYYLSNVYHEQVFRFRLVVQAK